MKRDSLQTLKFGQLKWFCAKAQQHLEHNSKPFQKIWTHSDFDALNHELKDIKSSKLREKSKGKQINTSPPHCASNTVLNWVTIRTCTPFARPALVRS